MRAGQGAAWLALAGIGVAVVVLAWWLGRDDFDYAAAFESVDGSGTLGIRVDVPALAGATPDAVRARLGEPRACQAEPWSLRCEYPTGGTQIVYIEGRADWMTIRIVGDGALLAPGTLARLGLPVRDADEADERQLRWRHHAGLAEVQLVGDDDGVHYARIKARTP